MSTPILELHNVVKRFGSITAVAPLTLSIPPGCTYGFIGPNGAGKTTTIRMIMDIIAPDEGQIFFQGRPRSRASLQRFGYLPEERGLYKKMTLTEVLEYFARLKGVRRGRELRDATERWLKRFDLFERRRDRVEALSKGNQQKVQFITTILHEPDLIILDEPFSGLDPISTELLSVVITELREAGKTVLFSSHVMEQAEKLCDYVFMIADGKKVLDDSLPAIKKRFGHGSWAVEFDSDSDGGGALAGIPGVERVVPHAQEGRVFYEVYLEEATGVSALLSALARHGGVRRVERLEPTLHKIFVELVEAQTGASGSSQPNEAPVLPVTTEEARDRPQRPT